MEALIKSSGIAPEKVMRIPIGVDLDIFKPQTAESRAQSRKVLDIPADAVVIGSFQKDGVGWGEGNEPKMIKGPDVFLEVIGKLKNEIPNLWVLLSGPARGYVKKGLEKLGVPYRHTYFKDYRDIAALYDALDLYLVASREEGGPKAVLESMAKSVPLVTTAVGQAADLVKHGENAMMSPIGDASLLARHSLDILKDQELKAKLTVGGFATATENSFEAQLPLWKEFFSYIRA
ncbi:glycosyltransferase family 4 protein [Candidatus Parcubacteria bacterium]|nr:glycosyltransferase family 4 protein [Candidatus Parcubacteria bacterium]